MSAPDTGQTTTSAEALTFRRWLKDMERYRRPTSLLGLTLPFAMLVVTVALSILILGWLFPLDGLEERAMRDTSTVRATISLVGGFFAYMITVMVMPDGIRDAIRVCLLALLAGLVFEAGVVGAFAISAILDKDFGMGPWIAPPVIALGLLPAMAIWLGTAYRFHAPTPAPYRRRRAALLP